MLSCARGLFIIPDMVKSDMVKILDGKRVADQILENIKREVEGFKIKPCLAVIIVGNDEASRLYVGIKQKACDKTRIVFKKYPFQESVGEKELVLLIERLNKDKSIHGILVQLPLPNKIDQGRILSAISPEKDVDGLHPLNLGRLVMNQETFVPCTPKGVIRLFDEYGVDLKGKDVVIINRSLIVGKPLALLMIRRDATVTVCHTKTKDIQNKTKRADIIVTAVGRVDFIKKDMVKKGSVVIDVGISKKNGKVVGDVDFENVKKVVSYITPVPGGVGPMTVAMLMENVLEAYKRLLK